MSIECPVLLRGFLLACLAIGWTARGQVALFYGTSSATQASNTVQRVNGDGTGKLTVPDDATVISVRATYDNTMSFYINCDANKDKGTAERGASLDHWYKVSDILALGVVAPNGCGGKKIPEKLQVVAKPGEFVFFVRKRNALEQFQE